MRKSIKKVESNVNGVSSIDMVQENNGDLVIMDDNFNVKSQKMLKKTKKEIGAVDGGGIILLPQ